MNSHKVAFIRLVKFVIMPTLYLFYVPHYAVTYCIENDLSSFNDAYLAVFTVWIGFNVLLFLGVWVLSFVFKFMYYGGKDD